MLVNAKNLDDSTGHDYYFNSPFLEFLIYIYTGVHKFCVFIFCISEKHVNLQIKTVGQ